MAERAIVLFKIAVAKIFFIGNIFYWYKGGAKKYDNECGKATVSGGLSDILASLVVTA